MVTLSFVFSLVFALPLAVVAFYLGNFVVLQLLAGYAVVVSIALCVAAFRSDQGLE